MFMKNSPIRHILTGSSNPALGKRITSALGQTPVRHTAETFLDGETYVRIETDITHSDVFVIQSMCPPVAENLIELMLLGDACNRAGAARVTAVVPYFGYARQDRRTKGGEPVGDRLVADIIAGRYHGIISLDLHNPSIEGFFTISVHHLTVIPLLASALRPVIPRNAVVVAPDLGAAKLARWYADLLDLPTAYIHKVRLSGEEVQALYLTGSVQDRVPVIVDDMISTGSTIFAAIEVLLEKGCTAEIFVAAVHGLFAGKAVETLAACPIERIFVSDSLPSPQLHTLPFQTVSIGKHIADQIESVSGNPRDTG
jgi:ribose-phosphate pyrophosphokinase